MSNFLLHSGAAVLAALTALYFALRYRMTYWLRRGIQHDKPELFFGNLRGAMETKHLADFFRASYDKFRGTGPFAGFFMLFNPAALLLDLDVVRQVLIKDFHNFGNRAIFYNERDDPLTANIFSLPTVEWRQLRQKLSPAFSAAKLRAMFPVIVGIGENFNATVSAKLEHGEHVLEFKDLCDRYTTDVTGNCIFGLECNSLSDPTTEFRTMNQNLFDNPRNHRAIDGLLYAFPRLSRWLRLRQIPDVTSEFYFRIVRETIALREREKERYQVQRTDLMSMLLEMKRTGALTLDEVVANAFIFFFAGFETSATTMTLALYELAKAPECQERAREELLRVLKKYDEKLSYECMHELSYLEQIIMETMRLHTIVPQLQRQAAADIQTKDPEYFIEKGTLILIPVVGIHHDPEVYPQPYEFRPERFTPAAIKARHPMSWLPFGEGPRNCIGLSMAKLQIRIGLASLLRNFRFSVVAETPKKLDYYIQCPFSVPKSNIFLGVQRL